jgi:fructose-specific phosphotransferase system IIC component
MTGSFGALKLFSVVFKVLACLMLALMLTGVVGIVMSRDASAPFPAPIVLNMVFSGILAFLLLYAFGEVIRLLLSIEAQTRKE